VTQIVQRYLTALTNHDWEGLRACLADDVVRVGPYYDEYRGADAYIAFLSKLMPTLPDYSMDVARITDVDDGCFVELAETVAGTRTDEAIVFEIHDDRIARVDVYIKTRPSEPRT
jgi:ketosteroid isomerase-like protein